MHLTQFNVNEHSANTEYLPSKYSKSYQFYLVIKCDILSYLATKSLQNNHYQSPRLGFNNQVFHTLSCPAVWLLLIFFNLALKANCTWLHGPIFPAQSCWKVHSFCRCLHTHTAALSCVSSHPISYFLLTLSALPLPQAACCVPGTFPEALCEAGKYWKQLSSTNTGILK